MLSRAKKIDPHTPLFVRHSRDAHPYNSHTGQISFHVAWPLSAPVPSRPVPCCVPPAIALLLLPVIGIALFLLRRNFQRGGMSRNVVAGLARKMAERGSGSGGGGGSAGGFGPMAGGGGAGGGGVPWMQRAPTEGVLWSLLGRMLGGRIRGMELVGVLRRYLYTPDCSLVGVRRMLVVGGFAACELRRGKATTLLVHVGGS